MSVYHDHKAPSFFIFTFIISQARETNNDFPYSWRVSAVSSVPLIPSPHPSSFKGEFSSCVLITSARKFQSRGIRIAGISPPLSNHLRGKTAEDGPIIKVRPGRSFQSRGSSRSPPPPLTPLGGGGADVATMLIDTRPQTV